MVTMVTRISQIWYLARKTLGATDLKLGMHIQLYSGSNMGWVPPGLGPTWPHFFLSCVRLKMPKMVFQQEHLNLRNWTNEPIYIWNQYDLGGCFKCMYMTTPISVSMSGPKKGQKWYFDQTNPWSNRLKTWYAYTT